MRQAIGGDGPSRGAPVGSGDAQLSDVGTHCFRLDVARCSRSDCLSGGTLIPKRYEKRRTKKCLTASSLVYWFFIKCAPPWGRQLFQSGTTGFPEIAAI